MRLLAKQCSGAAVRGCIFPICCSLAYCMDEAECIGDELQLRYGRKGSAWCACCRK
jgi:hypothetical protein